MLLQRSFSNGSNLKGTIGREEKGVSVRGSRRQLEAERSEGRLEGSCGEGKLERRLEGRFEAEV